MTRKNPLAADLDHVLAHTRDIWDDLRGARIFITGGTGFFGCWLLESFTWANDQLNLGASAVVLTRDPAAFTAKVPHLAGNGSVALHEGDVRTFGFPSGRFTHVIHAASDGSAAPDVDSRIQRFEVTVLGTHRVLQLARESGARRLLFTSSGAVYGVQPADVDHLDEEFAGGPDTLRADQAYGEAKRAAEMLCVLGSDHRLSSTIARCFAFLGPYLSLHQGLAAGNFVRDAAAGETIHIAGDGSPTRSYLYAADLAIWLWTILVNGTPSRAYNVGSPNAISILNLADRIAHLAGPGIAVAVAGRPAADSSRRRYVPCIVRAESELGLKARISLDEAIRRTLEWHRMETLA